MNGSSRPRIPGVTVYSRGKTWSYRIELAPDELTGKRRRDNGSGYDTEEEAWAAVFKAKAAEAPNRRKVEPSKRTVAEFFSEWLDSLKGSNAIKPSTLTNYTDYTDAYVRPWIGERRLQQVDVPMLNALYRRLLESGRRKRDTNTVMYEFWAKGDAAGQPPTPAQIAEHCKTTIHAARHAVQRYRRGRLPIPTAPGLAPKTVKNAHRMLHSALADAVAWGYVDSNPAVHAQLPREKRRRQRRKGDVWTPEQFTAWLRIAVVDRDAGMWVLAATTGARRSELAGAEEELLDLEVGELEFADTRVVVAGQAVDSDGKTDSGNRTVALDAFTIAYLRLQVARLAHEREMFGKDYHPAGKLFCHPDGTPIHPDTITRRFNRMVDQAGVPRIRLHDVRHSYVTVCLDAGVDVKIISDRVGHAGTDVTTRVYGHRSKGRDRAAAEQIAALFFGPGWQGPGVRQTTDKESGKPT
jgi:integrase